MNLKQLEAYERQYLIASGWHRKHANRGDVWVAPLQMQPGIVDVDHQETAVLLQKRRDRRAQIPRVP